jgi:uncharacterized protein YecE (DUF72 family)
MSTPRTISESGEPSTPGRVFVGTSGFSYAEWRGIFYPQKLPSKKFLSYYAEHFCTTEINNTFYRIPTLKLIEGWYAEVPDHFRFTLKLSQEITHRKKLRNVDEEMRRFLEGASALREKLATILVQLPPFYRKDVTVLEAFLSRFTARGKFAFEFRHGSWFDDDVYRLLRLHECSLAVVEKDDGEGVETPRLSTGPFVYMRLRKGDYSKAELQEWAQWIRAQSADVYCYLKHDEKAPVLAQQMLEALNTQTL